MNFTSFADLLVDRARKHPQQLSFRALISEDEAPQLRTYAELDERAGQIARHLLERAEPGDRALLLFPSGLDFIEALLGCFYAGIIAVPLHPPLGLHMFGRLQDIAQDALPAIGLTTDAMLQRIRRHMEEVPALTTLQWITPEQMVGGPSHPPQATLPEDVAMLQYTSGSTGTPKGVVLTHANLLHSAAQVHVAFGSPEYPHDKMVCWLPLFHDMGLMSGVLGPLFSRIEATLMSPAAVAQRPARWLEAMSRFKATLSGAPNFGYDQCTLRIPEEERSRFDLSTWQVAFCGAEPIRHETLLNFEKAFAPCGFRCEAFLPCYGLAEATVAVTASREPTPYVVTVSGESLQDGNVVEAAEGSRRSLIACGEPISNVRVLIVDPEQRTICLPDRVGEIWVQGPNVARGYWRQPERTQETFAGVLADTGEGPFLRTGDLGFIHDRRLCVTGRAKDMIVVRGQNYYPQDIEASAERSHDALIKGGTAAFSIDQGAGERMVIVQEVRRTARRKVEGLCAAIRMAVAKDHGVAPWAILLVWQGRLPKTTSGKIRRAACRLMLLEGKLEPLDVWCAEPSAFQSHIPHI
jgi:acyl-CoA synthetase (AMP-forming)/AMP-acid ligase II